MSVVITDAKSYVTKRQERCLHKAAKEKRICTWRIDSSNTYFPPFIDLVDGLLGVEAEAILKRIASQLATKWQQPYSRTCGYVKIPIAITLLWATH